MKITVSSSHITSGERRISNKCPVALAIKDATGASFIDVSGELATVGKAVYKLPAIAQRFIARFDKGRSNPKRFRGFTFHLNHGN